MFRKMRRAGQEISQEECVDILKQEKRGVLAVQGDGGYPYTVPLDFYYDEESGHLYFHGAKQGHKIDAIQKDNKVSFCTWDKGLKKPGDWAYYVTSVICFGTISLVTDLKKAEDISRRLGLKYYPDAESVEEEIRKALSRVQILELDIEHMTGKLVHEK